MSISPAVVAWFAVSVLVTRFAMDLFRPDAGPLPFELSPAWRSKIAFILNALNGILAIVWTNLSPTIAAPTALAAFLASHLLHRMIPDPGPDAPPPGAGADAPPPNDTPPPVVHARMALAMTLLIMAIGCVSIGASCKQGIRTSVDAADAACVLLKPTGAGGDVCATVEELTPFVDHLLAARAYRKAHPESGKIGAPQIDPCFMPLLPATSDAGP